MRMGSDQYSENGMAINGARVRHCITYYDLSLRSVIGPITESQWDPDHDADKRWSAE